MADDFTDFLHLYADQDEATIRERWAAWANEGITEADVDEWTDTRSGSFWDIATRPGVRESARIYDLLGLEVPMSAFPLWAWGEYLDDLGESIDVFRLAATPAAGTVRFTGTDGSEVGAGTRVGVEPLTEEEEAPEYLTTDAGLISGGFVDLPVEAVEAGTAGNVAANAVTRLLVSVTGVTSITNPTPLVGGTDPQEDEPYRTRILARYTGSKNWNAEDYESWLLDQEGVGKATVIPLFAGPGTILAIVRTPEGGPVSTARLAELQVTLDPPSFETTLTAVEALPQAEINVVSTAGARPESNGHIRVGDQLVSYTSFDADSFNGAAGGTGSWPIGTLVTQSGRGGGAAPVGHVVVLKTATGLAVTISATVEHETGYSLDGGGGTIATEATIIAAILEYVRSVEPGGEIVLTQVISRIARTPGVHDVGAVLINGVAANLPIPGDPNPQVPDLDEADITLTDGSV